jgi:hypothetical protein
LASCRRDIWRHECTPTQTLPDSFGALSVSRCNNVSPFQALQRHERGTSITHATLLTISIAAALGLGHAQVLSVPPESARSVPDTAHSGVESDPRRRSDQVALCSLRMPYITTQSKAKPEATTTVARSMSYKPLSPHCKLGLFLKQTYSSYTFASVAFGATEAQATGQWPHYGGGMQGWGKRFGATLANTESRRFIQGFALSTMLHQDPRYFYSPSKRLLPRVWYSVTRVVITKNDRGDDTFNTSEFLGALFSSALQNSYYPRHDRSLEDTMNRFSSALSSDVIGSLLHEFTPDMKSLFRKHAPRKILKIEEKLPILEDKP